MYVFIVLRTQTNVTLSIAYVCLLNRFFSARHSHTPPSRDAACLLGFCRGRARGRLPNTNISPLPSKSFLLLFYFYTKMANVFIIHGSYGWPGENWLPWLKKEIEKLGHTAYVPSFPTPKGQELSIWLDVFNKYIPKLDSETIMVGHSCGGVFLLRLLEKIDVKVKACFLVAGSIKPLLNKFDKVRMSFVDKEFDWSKITTHCRKFYPVFSDNDPYVPLWHGELLAEKLESKLIAVKGAGHFNAEAGYLEFELLLDMIKKELG